MSRSPESRSDASVYTPPSPPSAASPGSDALATNSTVSPVASSSTYYSNSAASPTTTTNTSGFTAVNGRGSGSPPQPPPGGVAKPVTNGEMEVDTIRVGVPPSSAKTLPAPVPSPTRMTTMAHRSPSVGSDVVMVSPGSGKRKRTADEAAGSDHSSNGGDRATNGSGQASPEQYRRRISPPEPRSLPPVSGAPAAWSHGSSSNNRSPLAVADEQRFNDHARLPPLSLSAPHPPPDVETRDSHAWYNASGAPRPPPPQPQSHDGDSSSPSSDTRMAEVLQRETRNMDASTGDSSGQGLASAHSSGHEREQLRHHRELRPGDPTETNRDVALRIDPSTGMPMDPESSVHTTAAGVLVDTKKRKRVFSNRTKTGCQTCRKRKKKCDEGKPECSNCTRGGFVCEGYAHKSVYGSNSRFSPKQPPVALQSKGSSRGPLMHPHRANAWSRDGQQTHTLDGQRSRPGPVEEDPPKYNTTPSVSRYNRHLSSNNPLGPPAAPPSLSDPPPPPPRISHSAHGGYEERPHNDHRMAHAPPSAHVQQYVDNLPNNLAKRNETLTTLPVLRGNHGPGRPGHEHRHSHGHVSASSMASTAQLALQHSQHLSDPPAPPISAPPAPVHHQQHPPPPHHQPPPPPPIVAPPQPMPEETEKQKMLNNKPYRPYNEQLLAEREACSSAVWRFNNAQNPSNGVSREERSRLFRLILEPTLGDPRKSPNPMLPVGRLGAGVVVEAPFYCSYGYNIAIGDNTSIARGCTILDPVRVTIGKDCKIGPNVDICAVHIDKDPSTERGVNGPEVGKMIHVADSVVIEARCVLKAGVQIGRGSRILAGSVVDKNVPPHVIFGGPVSDIIGGIWRE